MPDENRDDTGLRSLICPHCRATVDIMKVQAFRRQQLILLKCEHCGKYITKQQIDDTYREYDR